MSQEQDPRELVQPVAILRQDERILSGAQALMGYALLSTAKNSNSFIPMSELIAIQREGSENSHKARNHAYSMMKGVDHFLTGDGVNVERKMLRTGKQSGQIGYRLVFRDQESRERIQNRVAFSIRQAKDFKPVGGVKPVNSLFQKVGEEIVSEKPKSKEASDILLVEGVPTPVSGRSFENTNRFFSALSFPFDRKNPRSPFSYRKVRQSKFDTWARDWEILGKYLGTDLVGKEIAEQYGIRRSRVGQIVEKMLNQSYEAAPVVLKEVFPQENLSTAKPHSLHKGMRISEARGGQMRDVIEAVRKGDSNEEITKETGIQRNLLTYYRSKGIPVPYFREAMGREYQKNLQFIADGLLDDRQILAIFDNIEKHNKRTVCDTLKKAKVLVPLSKAARNLGLYIHQHESLVHRVLKDQEIPIVRIKSPQGLNYFFVLNNHEKTREVLTAHPLLDAFRTNPVEVLGKPTSQIPTTTIHRDPSYIRVGRLLMERGVPIRSNQAIKYIGPECPVSVFNLRDSNHRRNLLIRVEDSDALAAYLKSKLT